MLRIASRVFACMIVTSIFVLEPQAGYSRMDEMSPIDHSALFQQCAVRIEQWFPLLTVPAKELDLEHVKLARREEHLIAIPLKHPQGNIRSVHWHFKNMGEALDLVRLLQQGKISAMNVLPFLHDPAALYAERENLLEEMKDCQEKEQVQKILGSCTDCRVFEWLDIKP